MRLFARSAARTSTPPRSVMTRRRKLGARTAVVLAAIGLGPLGLASLEDRGAIAAGQAGAPAAARNAGAAAPLPAGHPPAASSATLPPGHPPTGSSAAL